MKWITALALGAGIAALAAIAWAAIDDTNGDGMISFDEAVATYPELTDETFATLDSDGDGLLSVDEIAAAEAAGLLASEG